MRLLEIKQVTTLEGEELANHCALRFCQDDGVVVQLFVDFPDPLPMDWRQWAEALLAGHLTNNTYSEPYIVLWPDRAKPPAGKDLFDQLPGWASWTGDEAAAWIEANVTDLASAKYVLVKMARAIVYLRDIVIES